MTGKLKAKKKSDLSAYSTMLSLNIDEYTCRIKDEVRERLDTRVAVELNDKTSVVRALTNYHGVVAHLITEYRRVKSRWLLSRCDFEKIETQSLNFARAELPAKSTEKQIKLLAYETNGDALYENRQLMEELEQKTKVINDHIELAKVAVSALQTAANLMKVEWEAGKTQ